MARQNRKRNFKRSNSDGLAMINPHAAGIDLGSKTHWVCLPGAGSVEERVFEIQTDTQSLNELADRLREASVTTVAMESTGVYWVPLYEILDARGFEVVLADTRSISAVPGRKTDVLDCQWIQQLHACGLLRGAFRPGDSIVAYRSLARMHSTLTAESADWLRRMQKELDQMNIRVHRAVSDIAGATGMRILHAIVAGERDPARLAELRDPRCRCTRDQIERELTGNWREEHLFNLKICLQTYEYLTGRIAAVEQKILDFLSSISPASGPAPVPPCEAKAKQILKRGEEPLRQALYRMSGVDLSRIDCIGVGTAQTILSEIGPDVGMFPTEKCFISYLRLAPGMAISGGKSIRGRKKKPLPGCSRARQALTMAALSAGRTDTALGAYYRSVAIRRGAGIAVYATARKLAQYIYRLLRFGTDYVDIGVEEYERRSRHRRTKALRERARRMGYRLIPIEEPALS
jgi:transposase